MSLPDGTGIFPSTGSSCIPSNASNLHSHPTYNKRNIVPSPKPRIMRECSLSPSPLRPSSRGVNDFRLQPPPDVTGRHATRSVRMLEEVVVHARVELLPICCLISSVRSSRTPCAATRRSCLSPRTRTCPRRLIAKDGISRTTSRILRICFGISIVCLYQEPPVRALC